MGRWRRPRPRPRAGPSLAVPWVESWGLWSLAPHWDLVSRRQTAAVHTERSAPGLRQLGAQDACLVVVTPLPWAWRAERPTSRRLEDQEPRASALLGLEVLRPAVHSSWSRGT